MSGSVDDWWRIKSFFGLLKTKMTDSAHCTAFTATSMISKKKIGTYSLINIKIWLRALKRWKDVKVFSEYQLRWLALYVKKKDT